MWPGWLSHSLFPSLFLLPSSPDLQLFFSPPRQPPQYYSFDTLFFFYSSLLCSSSVAYFLPPPVQFYLFFISPVFTSCLPFYSSFVIPSPPSLYLLRPSTVDLFPTAKGLFCFFSFFFLFPLVSYTWESRRSKDLFRPYALAACIRFPTSPVKLVMAGKG